MSQFNNQQQSAAAAEYPPQPSSYPPLGQAEGCPYAAPPPPVGYPTMDQPAGNTQQQQVPLETQSRGDKGFWEGCCAALCCCCLLESCF